MTVLDIEVCKFMCLSVSIPTCTGCLSPAANEQLKICEAKEC